MGSGKSVKCINKIIHPRGVERTTWPWAHNIQRRTTEMVRNHRSVAQSNQPRRCNSRFAHLYSKRQSVHCAYKIRNICNLSLRWCLNIFGITNTLSETNKATHKRKKSRVFIEMYVFLTFKFAWSILIGVNFHTHRIWIMSTLQNLNMFLK